MDRRGFLSTIAAGTLALLLPPVGDAAAIGEAVPTFFPCTVDGLTRWMEDRFITSMGEAKAFYELPIAEAVRKYGRINVDKNTEVVRFNYVTLAIATEGDDPVKAEERLTHEMMQRLQELKTDQHLVWRVKPQFASDEIIEFGDTWMTAEEIEDRKYLGVTPENVEHDFATNSLRYVKRKYTLNKLRMRVVFPNALNENFAENFYAQRKGEMTIRI